MQENRPHTLHTRRGQFRRSSRLHLQSSWVKISNHFFTFFMLIFTLPLTCSAIITADRALGVEVGLAFDTALMIDDDDVLHWARLIANPQ